MSFLVEADACLADEERAVNIVESMQCRKSDC